MTSRDSTRRAVFWAAAVAFVIVGVVSWIGAGEYLDEVGGPADWTDRLYLCVQAFTIQLPFEPQGVQYPPLLQLARFLGPVVLAWAAIVALAAIFRESFDEHVWVRWLARGRGHTIICGLGYVGGTALRHLCEVGLDSAPGVDGDGRSVLAGFDDYPDLAPYADGGRRAERVVAIELDANAGDVDEARRWGVPVIVGEATDARTWRRARLRKARRVLVACGNDQFNGEAADVARQLALRYRRPVLIAVHLDRPDLAERQRVSEYKRWHHDDPAGRPQPTVEAFSVTERSAARLLTRHPPFGAGALESDTLGEDQTLPHVVVIGDDPMAAAVLHRLGQLWSTVGALDKPPLPVTVVDLGESSIVDSLERRFPDASQVLAVSARPDLDLEAADMPGKVLDGRGDTRVYICLRDEPRGLSMALPLADEIETLAPGTHPTRMSDQPLNPVVVRTGKTPGLANVVLGSDWRARQYVEPFSPVDLATDEISLFGTRRERLARIAHEAYLGLARTFPDRGRDPTDRSYQAWEDLTSLLQGSNMDQVTGMKRNVALVGIPADARLTPLEVMKVPLPFDEAALEGLARLEHDRWLDFMERSEITRGPTRTLKHHPNIVPWEELSADDQRKDREAVLGYFRGLAWLGFRLPDRGGVLVDTFDDAVREAIAVAYYEQYRGQTAPGPRPAWSDLPAADQEANRASADAVLGHARAMGYRVRVAFGAPTVVEIPPEVVESASKREHQRWVDHQVAQGWAHGPERNDDQRLHPDLVPWSDLNEPTRDKDRVRIEIIPSLLAGVGMELVEVDESPESTR